LPGKLIIAGDWNAKSNAWGATDARGEVLDDWITGLGLECINRGRALCVRWQGGSVVDVTFATPAAARLIDDWWVEEEVESLSDHKYVRMDISAATLKTPGSTGHPSEASVRPPRWALKKIDTDALKAAAIVVAWPRSRPDRDINREAARIRDNIITICNAGMPRVRPAKKNPGKYTGGPTTSRRRE